MGNRWLWGSSCVALAVLVVIGTSAWQRSKPPKVSRVVAKDKEPQTRFLMADGSIVHLENAAFSWDEKTRSDGSREVGLVTGTHLVREKLHRTRRGRFFLWRECELHPGPTVEWLSHEQGVRWLLLNGDVVPSDLTELADRIKE